MGFLLGAFRHPTSRAERERNQAKNLEGRMLPVPPMASKAAHRSRLTVDQKPFDRGPALSRHRRKNGHRALVAGLLDRSALAFGDEEAA
jgi:hypothetical protein